MILPYIICITLGVTGLTLYLYETNPIIQSIVKYSGWGFLVCMDMVVIVWISLIVLLITAS